MHSEARQLPLDIRWHDIASLEQFHPGRNAVTLDALRSLLKGESMEPLFIYGGSGSGKTHLLQAACRRLGESGSPVFYLSLDQAGRTPAMLDGLDSMALVAIDSLERLNGDSEMEQALFHCYNRVRDGGGRLLIAARKRPADLSLGLADLRSRLNWGLVQRMLPLQDDDLSEALRQRARHRGLELPEETSTFMLSRLSRDPAGLFALLDRLDRAALEAQRRLTIPFVRQVLGLG
ncbi:DnaA family protein [Natronocella acetinitrilica]|uniref:DnaA family protein n=1 Tax=Natronocella acetinitrilica TaxID=414046 RepID=A0AAE3G584_9GAMM|nr:DnaA family protein [Natronocella acetinitrilica]